MSAKSPIAAILFLLSVASPTLAGDPPQDLDDHTAPPAEWVRRTEPGLPGMLAATPTPKGLLYKRWTPIAPEEWSTPDPTYRWLLTQIDAGVADARVMRMHYWLKQRLTPFDRPIPDGWRQRALSRLLSARGPSQPATAAGQIPAIGRWIPVGPTTIPGRVTGLSYVPGRPGWILAGMADGGVFLSRDHGGSWEPLTQREATQATGAVAADPHDPSLFFWATGEGNGAIDNYGGIGVLRSEDAGRTWTASDAFSSVFRCLHPDPAVRDRIWACGQYGLYRSDDSARTWVQVGGGLPTDTGATNVIFRPDDPSVMFAGMWNRGVWKSTDGGANWTQVGGGLPSDLARMDLALCERNPDIMVVASGLNGGDLWKSTDGGATWSEVASAPDHCGGQCWYDNVVAIAPDDCDTIYLHGVGIHISRDGGQTWEGTSSGVHVDHHAILVAPGGEVIAGSDGGVFLSTDYGRTYTRISDGLPTTQYYGGCGNDALAGWLGGGTQDNGSHRYRDTDGWRQVLGGDGGMCAASGDKILMEYQNTNLQRSLNGGNGFQDANTGIRSQDPRAWVGIIEKDPQDANTLYVGTNRVYRTKDFHDTPWEEILGPVFLSRMVSALAVSPADRNVLWVGYEAGGLFRSENALAPTPSFTDIRGGQPIRTIRRIVPHPSDPAAAWIIYSGFGYPKITYTPDAGSTYTDVTGDLPDVPVNDLVVDPGDVNVLVAATDLGIYRSDDGGATWYGFSDGLPTAAVVELFRHPNDGVLTAATHGRSMFRFRAAAAGPIDVPDGRTVPGRELVAERTAGGELWVRFDTETCTAERYHLFWGDLGAVSSGAYSGAVCDLDRGGEQVVPMPGAPGQSVFFLVASATAAGEEGPHGYDWQGAERPHRGVGYCGVTVHQAPVACP
ncbi:MAG: hypothetical protein D6718_02185 [Acidobacteria bacterium]|nr:MAG: hypothetical protein D6718_02185 [Acidobacteriota bacterium]